MTRAIAAQRKRWQLEEAGIGMPGDNSRILALARKLTESIDAAVLGGIGVYLHGRFAGKLPSSLLAPFKKLVDGVRADEASRSRGPRF